MQKSWLVEMVKQAVNQLPHSRYTNRLGKSNIFDKIWEGEKTICDSNTQLTQTDCGWISSTCYKQLLNQQIYADFTGTLQRA